MAKSKIGIAIDNALHAKVKSSAPLRGMNLEKAYEQALGMWLDQQPASKYRDSNEELHDALEQILNNGDELTSAAITAAIRLGSARSKPYKSERIADTPPENAEERRLITEYRRASYEKRRRMLAFAAKDEDLGPEVLPSAQPSGRRKSG